MPDSIYSIPIECSWFLPHKPLTLVPAIHIRSPAQQRFKGENGIVIVREELAFDSLRRVPHLVVNDPKFGERLHQIIQPKHMPTILVSIEEKAA